MSEPQMYEEILKKIHTSDTSVLDLIKEKKHTEDLYNQLLKDYDELQQRIEKAVEYIGEYKDYCDKEVCDCTPEYFEDLLDILNGKE